jgi:hypothetical protein
VLKVHFSIPKVDDQKAFDRLSTPPPLGMNFGFLPPPRPAPCRAVAC